MEENRSMSKIKRLQDYKNGWKATNKAIDLCCNVQETFGDERDLLGEFSWPPKSYSCSFCKREFRSAQALGGHMNVHRREKARLRQITPYLHPQFQHLSSNSKFLDLKLDSNPNLNPAIKTCFASNTPPFPKVFPPFTYSFNAKFNTLRSREFNIIGDTFDDFSHEQQTMIVEKLKAGLFAESKFEDLDLELRLGCS